MERNQDDGNGLENNLTKDPALPLQTVSERMSAAEKWVDACILTLPEHLALHARRIPCLFRERSDPADHWEGEDLLGLFLGDPELDGGTADPGAGGIVLFTETLWDYAEENPLAYRREVLATYLHELGHAVGLDEWQLWDRGIG